MKMYRGWTLGSLAAILAAAIASGCGSSNVEKIDKSQAAKSGAASQSAATGTSAAGVAWTVPTTWTLGAARPMRAATYTVGEGSDAAECAVFFFGVGQGGGVQANIDRWIGQFQQPDGSDSKSKAKTDTRTVNGLKVTTVDLTGTYMTSPGGPMAGQSEAKPGSRLLAAIVEAPDGPVFFKMTGPEATMKSSQPDFEKMLESVHKQ